MTPLAYLPLGHLGHAPPPFRPSTKNVAKSKVSYTAIQSYHLELINARKVKPGSVEKCLALQFLFGPAGFILALQHESGLGQYFFGFIRN